jgi:thymidylate synthase
MNYSFVIARDKSGIIAIDGQIPWMGKPEYRNDLKNFKNLTTGSIVIMGSKTYETLPSKRLLPNRTNVVISRRPEIIEEVKGKSGLAFDTIESMHKFLIKSARQLLKSEDEYKPLELFVIGGVELYNSMKHLITRIYLTIIPEESSVTSESKVIYFRASSEIEQHITKDVGLSEFSWNITSPLEVVNMNGMKYHIIDLHTNPQDEQFRNLIAEILSSDNYVDPSKDRTEFGYKAVYGTTLKFDISEGRLPMTTLRPQPFRWIVEELLWFLKGYTDNRILKRAKVSVWTKNTTISAIKKAKLTYNEDIAGPIYGFQWRHANGNYDEKDPDGFRFKENFESGQMNNVFYDGNNRQLQSNLDGQPFDPLYVKKGFKGGVDQVLKIIKDLLDPASRYSRRHIISGWNVAQLSKMVLPPCHVLYQFHVDAKDVLHCTFYQRSSDVALAASWNAASATILTNILAHLTNLATGTLTMFIGNAHVYTNHFENAKKLLERRPYSFPVLKLEGIRGFSNSQHPKTELVTDEIICSTIDFLDSSMFKIESYFSHPDVAFDMNA